MGGDHAPGVVVEGALEAIETEGDRVAVVLVGQERAIRDELARLGDDGSQVTIRDAPEVIGMAESPTTALKSKPDSSIHRGVGAVKQGHADAFASAGNTGAVMAAALFGLGRLPGVLRPALPGYLPTPTGTVIVLDVGANLEVRTEHLQQFAQMGSVFCTFYTSNEDPSVALVNVGEEPGKGTDLLKEAYHQLDETPGIRFVGNVEGRDILQHGADVCVCDGLVGNIVLKLAESVATILPQMVRAEIGKQGLGAEQAGLVGGVLKGMLAPFDYQTFGGSPLLGIDGTVVIGHGGSSAKAIAQMIRSTADHVEQDVPGRIAAAVAPPS